MVRFGRKIYYFRDILLQSTYKLQVFIKFSYLGDHVLPTKFSSERCVNYLNHFQLKVPSGTFSIAEIWNTHLPGTPFPLEHLSPRNSHPPGTPISPGTAIPWNTHPPWNTPPPSVLIGDTDLVLILSAFSLTFSLLYSQSSTLKI